MTKRKLDKTDIGEMYHWVNSALHSGFLEVEIDSYHATELCERALDNVRLTEENAKLREQLKHSHELLGINSGYHGSPSCINNERLLNQLEQNK